MYTDLKCQQANLEKCLRVSQQRQRIEAVTAVCSKNNFPNSPAYSRTLHEQEIQAMAEGIKDDYNIEEISPYPEEEYVEENNNMLVEQRLRFKVEV